MIERRFVKGSQVRAAEDGKPAISGYASVFNEQYDSGWFIETIKPGAFSRALREAQDVRMLLNHDANFILGRTKADTLTLREDTKGLFFDCTLPDTQAGNDVRTLIQRGDLDGCSFAFQAVKQEWREAREDPNDPKSRMIQYRDIADLDLYDASVVTYPAYEGTSVGARSLWPDGVPAEVRSHVEALREMKPGADMGDSPSNPGDGGDDTTMEPCSCPCESCSACTQRSKPPATEQRAEPIISLEQAKAHTETLRAQISLV